MSEKIITINHKIIYWGRFCNKGIEGVNGYKECPELTEQMTADESPIYFCCLFGYLDESQKKTRPWNRHAIRDDKCKKLK